MVVGGIKDTDFTGFPLQDFGVDITLKSYDKILYSDGSEELLEIATITIKAILNPKINKYSQEKLGLLKETDAYIMLDPNVNIKKDDTVSYNNNTWRVINVIEREVPAGGISLYKFCELSVV